MLLPSPVFSLLLWAPLPSCCEDFNSQRFNWEVFKLLFWELVNTQHSANVSLCEHVVKMQYICSQRLATGSKTNTVHSREGKFRNYMPHSFHFSFWYRVQCLMLRKERKFLLLRKDNWLLNVSVLCSQTFCQRELWPFSASFFSLYLPEELALTSRTTWTAEPRQKAFAQAACEQGREAGTSKQSLTLLS